MDWMEQEQELRHHHPARPRRDLPFWNDHASTSSDTPPGHVDFTIEGRRAACRVLDGARTVVSIAPRKPFAGVEPQIRAVCSRADNNDGVPRHLASSTRMGQPNRANFFVLRPNPWIPSTTALGALRWSAQLGRSASRADFDFRRHQSTSSSMKGESSGKMRRLGCPVRQFVEDPGRYWRPQGRRINPPKLVR